MRECQVWWAALDDVRPEYQELLDPVERGRRQRYLRDPDRDRFTLGVAMTRLAAGALLGVAPEKVPISRSCLDCDAPHGRPIVQGGPFVSVSHSGDRVALAVSTEGPVGVDVEAVRPLEEGIASHVLAPGEAGGDLFSYWTRKEAILKATGDGLRVRMTALEVSGPAEPPRLLGWEGRAEMVGRISMHTLDPGPGYAACLALIDQPDVAVRQEPAALR